MMRRILLLFAVLLVSCTRPVQPVPAHATDVSWRYKNAVDFQLTDTSGKARRLADFRDKVVVLFFGYTHCPEVCPTTLADLAQVMRVLGTDANKVKVIFVTLDPERDTADVLARFVPAFSPSFLGLYGDAQATAQAASTFGVNYEKHFDKSGGYTLDHSDWTYLIGGNGQVIWLSPYQQRTGYLAEDINLLLKTVR
jgi:protein SCO1/2